MEIDYKKLEMKSGLEIHQQIDSHKLFCNCPSVLRSDEPEFIVSRKLHAVAGESGEIDLAVAHEAKQNKEFTYQAYDTTCLVELDEEPPHPINLEALKIAIQIALHLNCEIIPITQVMRKTVLDGSNTGGFQRTVLIARGGYVKTSLGKVGITSIFLEEDSARPVSRNSKESIYRLDRLGIPLVEIVTDPDIKSPEHAKETALHIGNILRSCKVRRGIGTIRQDINISIKDSNRVELKGFQNPKIMIKTVENELLRQKKILDSGGKNPSEVRNCLADGTTEFSRPMPGSARMYPETDIPLLKISRNFINDAKKDLPKLKSKIESDLKKQGLSEEMIKTLFKQNRLEEYKELYGILNNPMSAAKILFTLPKDIAKKLNKSLSEIQNILGIEVMRLAATNLASGKIPESYIKHFFEKIANGENPTSAISFKEKNENEIEEKVMKIIKEKPGLNANAYMGLIMKEFKEQVDGKRAMELINKFLKNTSN